MIKQFIRTLMFEASYFLLDKIKLELQRIEIGEDNVALKEMTVAHVSCDYDAEPEPIILNDAIAVLEKFKIKK
jgi:hypothetical protein